MRVRSPSLAPYAGVVESADAEDSKSSGSDTVWVQVPPSAPRRICIKSQPCTIFSVLMVTRPSASTGMRGLQSRSTSDVSHANRIWQYDWRWLQHDLIRRKTQVRVLLPPPTGCVDIYCFLTTPRQTVRKRRGSSDRGRWTLLRCPVQCR